MKKFLGAHIQLTRQQLKEIAPLTEKCEKNLRTTGKPGAIFAQLNYNRRGATRVILIDSATAIAIQDVMQKYGYLGARLRKRVDQDLHRQFVAAKAQNDAKEHA